MQKISLVIPTLNEEATIPTLVERIHQVCSSHQIQYEIIFIDDHSTDTTFSVIQKLSSLYPITLRLKKGKIGKAFSLLEGFSLAKYPFVGMIDADLQYPPEALVQMIDKLTDSDIVVANRVYKNVSFQRKILSKIHHSICDRWLHQITCDVQSGLKVFKKEIIERVNVSPSPWTFDLEFLLQARDAGYSLATISIPFSQRTSGFSKVALLQTSLELFFSSVRLKLRRPKVISFHSNELFKKGQGFHYKGIAFVHHSTLPVKESAFYRLTTTQQKILFFIGSLIGVGIIFNWHTTLITLLGILTLFYFCDLLFSLFVIFRNFYLQPEISINENELSKKHIWPRYTILCPLYKESAVVEQFIFAMQQLDYPHKKLEVLLLLEEDDDQTIAKVTSLPLPDYIRVVIVPHSLPKTKPKALNYGLLFASGEYCVIYDAEDVPDPEQLKKVVLAFEKKPINVACIQAKLNFYNPHQNLLTRVFTAEYSLWFDLVLTGLQSLNAPIPLGGTSNHFRTTDIINLKGWDSFNVTEDCDLGIRLTKEGYLTAIVNSTTYEEANSNIANWFAQRGRWIKGYIQSYFVHTRNPQSFLKNTNKRKFFIFQIVVGGKILSLFINPIMWIITVCYFIFRPTVGHFIESLFPPTIFYIGIVSLVFGNFLYLYYYMIATIKRHHYSITKFAYLVPFYWLCMSIAAWHSIYTMIFRTHYWAKTIHGLHFKKMHVLEKTTSDNIPFPYHQRISVSL